MAHMVGEKMEEKKEVVTENARPHGRIKIVSNGTTPGTFIYNHNGERIGRVQKVTIEMDANEPFVKATLVLNTPIVEIEVEEVEVIEETTGKINK